MPGPGVVLLAMDKFKGSLDAQAVCHHLAEGLRRGNPAITTRILPVADGGDGSVAAAVRAGFTPHVVRATGARGLPVDAMVAVKDSVAVIEVAEVCGLHQTNADQQAPLTTTTYGVGELVDATLALGCTTLIIGLGGSATIDGGTGMLAALGARFTGDDGRPLPLGGGAMDGLAKASLDAARARLRHVRLVLATDVDNPLLGRDGAARTYGPQKGADQHDVRALEASMGRLVTTLPAQAGRLAEYPGAGAAGGLGFAGLLLGGEMRPGAEFFLDLLGFDNAVAGATRVVTGEGRLDHQTMRGKAPARVAERARRAGVPTIAVAGACTLSPAELHSTGIASAVSLMDLDARCATDPDLTAFLLQDVGERLATALSPQSPATITTTTPHLEGDTP